MSELLRFSLRIIVYIILVFMLETTGKFVRWVATSGRSQPPWAPERSDFTPLAYRAKNFTIGLITWAAVLAIIAIVI